MRNSDKALLLHRDVFVALGSMAFAYSFVSLASGLCLITAPFVDHDIILSSVLAGCA